MSQRKLQALSGTGKGSHSNSCWWSVCWSVQWGGTGGRKRSWVAVTIVEAKWGVKVKNLNLGGNMEKGEEWRMQEILGAGCRMKWLSGCVWQEEGSFCSSWVREHVVCYCRSGAGSPFCSERDCFASDGELRSWPETWQAFGLEVLELWEALFSRSQDKRRQACFHCCLGKYLVIIGWFLVLLSFVGWLNLLENKFCSVT